MLGRRCSRSPANLRHAGKLGSIVEYHAAKRRKPASFVNSVVPFLDIRALKTRDDNPLRPPDSLDHVSLRHTFANRRQPLGKLAATLFLSGATNRHEEGDHKDL